MSWDLIVKTAGKILERLTVTQKTVLFLLSSGALTGLILLLVWSGNPQYRVLFSGLEGERAGQVVQELNQRGVAFELSDEGRTVLVPHDRVDQLRLELVSAGVLPAGGPKGYELFDDFKIGVPESIQLVNKKRALEGELARTIGRIRAIKRATVHLTPAAERAFKSKDSPAKASVMVELNGVMKLTVDQVAGIAHLVAGSVENLAPEDVTILDSRSNILSQKTLDASMSLVSRQLQIQKEIEDYRAQKAQSMLDNVLGPGKATVRVSAQLDFEKTESTVETYDPDGQVIRMESVNKMETRTPGQGGSTGAAARLGGLNSGPMDNTNDTNERKTEYENSKTVQRTVNDGVRIKKLAVSLILDEGMAEKQANLEAIVKNAVGFEEGRGDTMDGMVAAFPPPEELPPPPGFLETIDVMETARYGTVLLTFLFAFLLIRFLVGKGKKQIQLEAVSSAGPLRVEASAPSGGEKSAAREQVIRAIEQDPAEAARLLQTWLSEEE